MSRGGAPTAAPAPPAHRDEGGGDDVLDADASVEPLVAEVDQAVRSLIDRHEMASGTRVSQAIAVVAARTGDGVSTVARGLAGVLATDFGVSVCLLDLGGLGTSTEAGVSSQDGTTPEGEEGLFEVLDDWRRIRSVLRPTDHPAVSRLPAGRVPPRERYALARRSQFELAMKRLRRDFGFVVLDTPPVVQGGNALPLLRHADAMVIVVRSGHTSAGQVRDLASEVSAIPCIGAVLNAHRSATPGVIRRLIDG